MSAATEHLTPERLLDYARRALDPIDLLTADDHLIACAGCRSRIVDEEGLRATVTSLEREIRAALPAGPEHLPYDQVELLAEDRLRGAMREIAESHAETCASCRAEIADLKGFAAAFRESRRAAAAALVAAAARPGSAVASAAARAAAAAARTAAADGGPAAGDGDRPLFSADAASRGAQARWWVPRPPFVAMFAVAILLAGGGWVLRGRNLALKGKVDELTRQNESLAGRAAEADALRARLEQKAAPAAQPVTAVALKDRAGDVGLDDDGQLTGLDLLPVAEGRAVAAALRHAKVEVAAVTASLALPAPAGDSGAPAPVSPAGTVVRGQRPTLSWDAITGAAAYTIVVSDESGAVAARADNVRGHTWTVPRPLRRGATYTWRVSAGRMAAAAAHAAAARVDGAAIGADAPAEGAQPAAPEGGRGTAPASAIGLARFRVLDKDEAAALDRLLRSSGGSALAAGVFYARAGLLDDAEKELRAVLDANPDSPIAKSIVQSFLEERVRNSAPAGATR